MWNFSSFDRFKCVLISNMAIMTTIQYMVAMVAFISNEFCTSPETLV